MSIQKGSQGVNLKYYFFQDIGDLPDFELPEVLPDLPGIAQNLAFVLSSLDDLPEIPFFEDVKSVSVLSPPLPVLSASLPDPQTEIRQVQHQQEELRPGPPLPPIDAPPTLPPFFPEPELPEIPMASKPVKTSAPARQPDEPGKQYFG